jgi:hypothetical protein
VSAYRHLQPSFAGGQISRRLQSRVDTQIYPIALAEMTNMITAVEGPAMKRPGTRTRAAALASASWLMPFIFNATQSYVLVWSDGKVRFFTNDAPLLSGGSPVEVTVPYAAAQAPLIGYFQNYDTLYLAHDAHAPATLVRTSATSFSHAPLQLTVEPFDTTNSADIFVTASGATVGSTITLTATSGIFDAGHVGSQMRLEAEDFGSVQAWQPGIDGVVIGTKRRSEGKVYVAETAGRTGNVVPVHTRGEEWDGSDGTDINAKGPFRVRWRYLHDLFGIVKITSFTSATEVQAEVIRTIPDTVVGSGTTRWAHALFSAKAGWPHLVFIFRGRLGFIKDNRLALSVLGDLRDFSEFNEEGERSADMGFVRSLEVTDRPLWARVDGRNLVVGTSRGEWIITAQNSSEILSGANIQAEPQTWHGGTGAQPCNVGQELIFVQRGGRKVRAMAYALERDRYRARDLLIYARQFGRPSIRQLAYQAEPEELLWALRGDGTVAAHPYNPDQDMKGWSLGIAIENAQVKSIVSIPSTDGARDDLWLLVQRGSTLTVDQLAPWWDEDEGRDPHEAFHLDSGITYDGAPATVIAGLSHLANEPVMIMADGVMIEGKTVSGSGTVTLDAAASVVHIGKPFTARLRTLAPEIPRRDGTGIGLRKRITHLTVRLIDSLAVRAGGRNKLLDYVLERLRSDEMNAAPSLQSGTFTLAADGGYAESGEASATFEDRSPYPWIMPAVVTHVLEGDK